MCIAITRQLRNFTFLFFVTIVEATGPINWTAAASLCLTLYDSKLIPLRYIEDHNLTRDIIDELKPGASAWIDGQIENIGCYQENCLKIKRMHQRKDTKLPYICINSKSVDINEEHVQYQESEKLCNEDKFSIRKMFYVHELIKRLGELPLLFSMETFWIPNVKITDNIDTLCTFVTTRENSMDTFTGNCSSHQLGICINNSYVSDYQFTLMLEKTLTTTETDVHVDSAISAIESAPISNSRYEVVIHDMGNVLVVLAVVASVTVVILLWKKRLKPKKERNEKLQTSHLRNFKDQGVLYVVLPTE